MGFTDFDRNYSLLKSLTIEDAIGKLNESTEYVEQPDCAIERRHCIWKKSKTATSEDRLEPLELVNDQAFEFDCYSI